MRVERRKKGRKEERKKGRKEERKKGRKEEKRADRNMSPSTIARTGPFYESRAWIPLTLSESYYTFFASICFSHPFAPRRWPCAYPTAIMTPFDVQCPVSSSSLVTPRPCVWWAACFVERATTTTSLSRQRTHPLHGKIEEQEKVNMEEEMSGTKVHAVKTDDDCDSSTH